MAQHDYDINSSDSISGFQFRQDTNNALAAIKSTNSGAVAPTSPVAGMLWLDTSTTPNILKVRDTANSAWLEVYVEAKMGTTIASASITTIGNYGSGEVVHISGTATISAFGTSRIGTRRVLVFDAAATLVHNVGLIICPGVSNITCSIGTVVTVICEGGSPSVWRVVDVVHPNVSYTELGYLDGVTSSIQTQLNGKQATITGAATTIDTENLPVSMALVSDTSGKVATHGTVSSTELGYLDGVTSGIQGQINSKQAILVSGTNIKTINSTSILGSGDISIPQTPSTQLIKAWCNYCSAPSSGTYTQSGTSTITVTITAHGLSTGMIANLQFTSGTATSSNDFIVTVTGANTFTIIGKTTVTTSGNVTMNAFIRSGYNVSSITDNGVGVHTLGFINAMTNIHFCVNATTLDDGLSARYCYEAGTYGQYRTTSSVRLVSVIYSGTVTDTSAVYVQIIGD